MLKYFIFTLGYDHYVIYSIKAIDRLEVQYTNVQFCNPNHKERNETLNCRYYSRNGKHYIKSIVYNEILYYNSTPNDSIVPWCTGIQRI